MHLDNVFDVFIFLFYIFGYFFCARRGAYLMSVKFYLFLSSNFGGKCHKNVAKYVI